MIKGDLKIDVLTLRAFKVELPQMHILTRVDLVDSGSMVAHATIKSDRPHQGHTWSKGTIEALQTLVDLIERDLARIHLKDYDQQPESKGLKLPESGLGEHLSAADAPSI